MKRCVYHGWVRAALVVVCVAMFAIPARASNTVEVQMKSGRFDRQYTLVLPDAAEGRRLPVVFVLHGTMMSGKSMRRLFGLDEIVEREGVALVYPDATGRVWNDGRSEDIDAPNDVHFIIQIARQLVDRGIADQEKLYLVGLSSGGMLAFKVACEAPRVFAAHAALMANIPEDLMRRCRPGGGVPMLLINSRRAREPDISGSNEWGSLEIATAPATANFWRRVNGCDGKPQTRLMPDIDPRDGSTITAEQHLDCSSGATVVSFMTNSDSLLPPGARVSRRSSLVGLAGGPPNGDISAADVTWKFFRRFPMK